MTNKPKEDKPNHITVTIYEGQCPFCKKKIRTATKEEYEPAFDQHIKDCKIYHTIKRWDELGIRKEMVQVLQLQDLDEKLQRLIKEYGFDQVKEALDSLEE